MGKKHKHPEHENLERWLVSYADFITLLFATFTALYAIASSDLAKMQNVAEAISQGFEEQSLMHGIKSILQGKSPPADNPNPIASEKGKGKGVMSYESMTYMPGELKDVDKSLKELKQEAQEINQAIDQNAQQKTQKPESIDGEDHKPGSGKAGDKEDGPSGGVEVSVQERGIKVSIDSSLLFNSGSAAIKPQAINPLDKIASRLERFSGNHIIQVEGHTDNLPIFTAIYPSNWELSTARACSVVRFFIKRHSFSPETMTATGYGDSRPLETNETLEGRQKNRRIDIIVLSKMVGNKSDPNVQKANEQPVLKHKPYIRLDKAVLNPGEQPTIIQSGGSALPSPANTSPLEDLKQKTTIKPTIIPGKPDITGGKHVLVIPAVKDKR